MSVMGKRIFLKRTEKGLTMEELGAKLGVKSSAVNKWEKGTVENIKRSTIEEMAKIFECSPVWLMGLDDTTVTIESLKEGAQNLDTANLERFKAYVEYLLNLRIIDEDIKNREKYNDIKQKKEINY